MQRVYKFSADMPYSLHDAKVTDMQMHGGDLRLLFGEGLASAQGPHGSAGAEITIGRLDMDFSSVCFLPKGGRFGPFMGRKLPLQEFLDKFKGFTFEIVDELYGYNKLLYAGYIDIPGRRGLREFELSVYFFGDIIYRFDYADAEALADGSIGEKQEGII